MSFGYFSESITLYTTQAVQEYTQVVVEKAVKQDVLSLMEEGTLMKQKMDNEGNVVYSSLDIYKSNKIRSIAASNVIDAIEIINLHEDFQMVELPIGYFFSRNMFLSNGIKIPINFEVVGSHSTDILVDAKSQGINSSVVYIYLNIKVSVQVTIPFQAASIDVDSRIPLSIEIINSDIPQNYYNGLTPIPGLVS